MPFKALTAGQVVEALAGVGVNVASADITLEPRLERWLVRLPNERLAWFGASKAGCETLRTDRGILRLIQQRCTFQAPRILVEDASGEFDVRAMVTGASDPFVLHSAAQSDARISKEIGASIGAMLAELHTKIRIADIDPAVQHNPDWPESRNWILERLPSVINDDVLIVQAGQLLAQLDHVEVENADRVLIHGDLGMHAFAYDPKTFRINGIFDFEGAAVADRHHDFRYLSASMLDAALNGYQRLTGCVLDRHRISVYGAACALSYLAFREGHAPEEVWCGRTLEDDLKYTRSAIAHAEKFSDFVRHRT